GDTNDLVVHVYDRATGSVTNTRLACSHDDTPYATTIAATDSAVAFTVNEADQGMTDLNGDGDTNDNVVHAFDGATHHTRSLGLGVTAFEHIKANGDLLTFRVSERVQGGQDLDGDGDALDRVLHVVDTVGGSILDTGLPLRDEAQANPGIVVATVNELDQ